MDLSYSNTSNNDANIFLSFAFELYTQWTREKYLAHFTVQFPILGVKICLFVFKYVEGRSIQQYTK